MLKPGTLIVIGVVALVVGLMPDFSVLCLTSGAACVYLGIKGLRAEAKEKDNGPKDRDQEGSV